MTLAYKAISIFIACFMHIGAAASPQPFDLYDGLGNVKILDSLPSTDQVGTIHHADFHFGAITNKADWAAVAAANGGGKSLPSNATIDWNKQAVVYVILAEQTNQLNFTSLTIGDGGAATLRLEWIGIEPFYYSHMPVLFKVVDKDQVDSVTIKFSSHEGFGKATLGTLAIR